MEKTVAHQSSEYVQTISFPDIVNFALGQPGGAIIPKSMIDNAFVIAFYLFCCLQILMKLPLFQAEAPAGNEDPYIYQYASTCGTQAFRKAIAGFLARKIGIQVDIANLCPTFGNSEALSRISRSLGKPGDVVIVEEFTYYLAGDDSSASLFDAHWANRYNG